MELKRHSVRGVKYNGEEICGGFAYYDADEVDAAIAELKQKLEDVQASHYAEMVDAGMRERRLRRALFIALSYEAKYKKYWYCELLEQEGIKIISDNKKAKKYNAIMKMCQKTERKCRAKAEQYK